MNPNSLNLSTDYPLDKVVGFQSGTAVIPSSPIYDQLIPHGLSFTPLSIAKWSFTPTFDISYDMMSVFSSADVSMAFRTNGTYLNVRAVNFTNSNITVYWKVLYFMPSDIDQAAAFTQDSLDTFNINTDYNYTKLLKADVVSGPNATYTHGLGYYPQVEVWWEESGGWITQLVESVPDSPRAVLTTTQLQMISGTFLTPSRWHYRVYTEQN